MITRAQFLELLNLQVSTNTLYGVKWDSNSVRNAIYREWGEFLDEVESHWHCYKKEPKFDRTAAVYELVDISHFMLVHMLGTGNPEQLAADPNFPRSGPHLDQMWQTEWMFTEFMHQPTPWNYIHFIHRACALLSIDTDTYMKAHHAKNARNRIRATSGVIEGKYDKSTEIPLTLEF